jgi:hypothetical protein
MLRLYWQSPHSLRGSYDRLTGEAPNAWVYLAATLWDLHPVSPTVVPRRQGSTLMSQTYDIDYQGFQKYHPRILGLRLHIYHVVGL